MEQTQEATSFQPQKIVTLLEHPLSFLRSRYSTSFASLFSKQPADQEEYKNGLIGIACLLAGFVLLWGLVLIFFMIKGSAVGCASGRAFETRPVERRSSATSNSKQDEDHPPSTTESEMEDTHSIHNGDETSELHDEDYLSTPQHDNQHQDSLLDDSLASSLCSMDVVSQYDSESHSIMSTESHEDSLVDSSPRVEGPRAVRTRLFFFVVALCTLACIPLALSFVFAPMEETVKVLDSSFDETRDMVAQTRAAASIIETAYQSTASILSQTTTNFSSVCPNISETDANQVLGVNLLELTRLITTGHDSLQADVTNNITKIENMLHAVEEAMVILEDSLDQTEDLLLLVPGLLLAVGIVTALATFGVVMAWKQDSRPRLQRFMSYGVLPGLIIVCLLCWILAIGATVSTAASTDFCLAGTSSGSPDLAIHDILITHGDYPNTTKYQYLTAYASGCHVLDATLPLVVLEQRSRSQEDYIWQYIAEIDAQGRSTVANQCGGSGLDEILSAARNVAKLLTKERRALDSMSDSLRCERVHPIYSKTVNISICTDMAEATAWGTVLFVALGVGLMVLITLRASWRHRVDEERIYHDESEVAENMIVNEHEEYLRYISKYKHEWQEYNGFGAANLRKSDSSDEEEELSYPSCSENESQTTDFTDHDDRADTMQMDDELTSNGSGDISFPSLQIPPSDDAGPVGPVPPSILSPLYKAKGVLETDQAIYPQQYMTPAVLKPREAVQAQQSSDSAESTDFSSIGRNAGRDHNNSSETSPTLFWKNQILGVEVELLQNDSLELSESDVSDYNGNTGIPHAKLEPCPSTLLAAPSPTDDNEERRESLVSTGLVHFVNSGSEGSLEYVQKQVEHFSKSSSKIGRLPVTPSRSKRGLSGFIDQFDSPSQLKNYGDER